VAQVHQAVSNWRAVALGPGVGLSLHELTDFAPAFEHEQMRIAALIQ
jgi:serine/threonine-protein kinase HipA